MTCNLNCNHEKWRKAQPFDIQPPSTPTDLVNFGRAQAMPLLAGVALGALAVLTIAHQRGAETARPALELLGVAADTPMITRDMVAHAKPDPDLFLAAAALLDVERSTPTWSGTASGTCSPPGEPGPSGGYLGLGVIAAAVAWWLVRRTSISAG